MALVPNDLVRIRSVGDKGVYIFKTDDAKDIVQANGYFNNFIKMLNVGDLIIIMGGQSGTPYNMHLMVTANDATNVTCSQLIPTTVRLGDISTKAADAAVMRFVAPVAGRIVKVNSILNGALATGDGTVTWAINGTGITTGVLTLTQAGSAAGNKASAVPTALNTFAAGDTITATVSGASTATATAGLQFDYLPN